MKSSLIIILACFHLFSALPEPGVWEDVPFKENGGYLYFTKNMYKDTMISLKIHCKPASDGSVNVRIGWILRYSPCSQEYQNLEGNVKEESIVSMYYRLPDTQLYPQYNYKELEYMKYEEEHVCDDTIINLAAHLTAKPNVTKIKPAADTEKSEKSTDDKTDDTDADKTVAGDKADDKTKIDEKTGDQKKPERTGASQRRKREETGKTESPKTKEAKVTSSSNSNTPKATKTKAETEESEKAVETKTEGTGSKVTKAPSGLDATKVDNHDFVKAWKSGSYVLVLRVDSVLHYDAEKKPITDKFDAKATVSMKGSVGYISAVEWPLLIFYGVMGLVYIIYGLIWLVMLACNWRDLLRVQYWVGGVIILGMFEKAVFYSEYQSIANTGKSVTEGAVIFAEIVSCLKRALARMLVIIVSIGFGIVKPRLGPTFHKVLFVGGLYFVLATIEGCMRMLKPKGDQSTDVMLSAVPLAVVDASICWWIFSNLVQTTRQLRLRRNIVKLTLYRHFTNTLIFAVLASIIFMIWSIVQIKMKTCIEDWQELWIDEAFWHLLFSVILLVIMILWRPSSNNQRYAFSPLLDAVDDEEEDDPVMNDAFDGMKMRTKQATGSPKQKQTSIEDDLKWVEDNIPSSISDKAQALLDSDEEIMTAKYEMSKMQ